MNTKRPVSGRWGTGMLVALSLLATAAAVAGVVHLITLDFRRQSHLINVSCRTTVGVGGEPMIAGFVIGNHSQTIVMRALGPSLAQSGGPEALQQLRLRIVRNEDGVELARNEGWRVPENERLWGDLSPYAPPDLREAVCIVTLARGAYSAVIESRNGVPGIASLEIFVILD